MHPAVPNSIRPGRLGEEEDVKTGRKKGHMESNFKERRRERRKVAN